MMDALTLPVVRLTRAAFAPYGEVIETDGAHSFLINAGNARRYHDLAHIDTLQADGRPLISIFRADCVTMPLTIRTLERHPLGSQAFVPLERIPFLVVVASTRTDGMPDTPLAFLTDGHQGVNYRRGVWHHPLLALQTRSDFLVIDRGGDGNNCELGELDRDYLIAVVPK